MDNTIAPSSSGACSAHSSDRFQAKVNGKPFLSHRLRAMACLRTELEGTRNCKIWKIHAVGKVGKYRTVFGFFIDQSLEPGTYDLVNDSRLAVIYHRTPKRCAQVFHSRDFQTGSLTLLACNDGSECLRGTFEFGIPDIGFNVTSGEFDLQCRPVSARQKSADALG